MENSIYHSSRAVQVIDPWHMLQWQEGGSYGLHPLKCFGQAQKGFCSCMCVHITAKHWAMSILHSWIICVILILQITNTIPVIWVIKLTELDWLPLIWLFTRKLIFKEIILDTVITNYDNVMLNRCALEVFPKRLEFLLKKESWGSLKSLWN